MPRMKKGEPGHEQAVNKWRATMCAKYGGEEGFKGFIHRNGAKGGHNSHGGGFTDKDFARRMGAKGGRASKRAPGTYDAKWDEHFEEIMSCLVQNVSYAEIARRVGIPASSIRYRLRK